MPTTHTYDVFLAMSNRRIGTVEANSVQEAVHKAVNRFGARASSIIVQAQHEQSSTQKALTFIL